MAALAANVTGNATGTLAPYGLLSPAVKVIEDGSLHWESGFTYETLGCAGLTTLHSVCSSASASGIEPEGDLWRSYKPFVVRVEFTCSTASRTPEELEQLARNEIDVVIQKMIEREFMSGDLAQAEPEELDEDNNPLPRNRYLADGEVESVTTGAVKMKQALALLEDAIAYTGNGAQGVIHVPRSVASQGGLADNGDGVLRTGVGTPVVAGVGYSPAPGETTVTLYGTGPVTVRLGPVVVTPDEAYQAVNRQKNRTTYVATRTAAVTWDSCVHFSADVDLKSDY